MEKQNLKDYAEKAIKNKLSSLKHGTRFYDWRTRSLLYEQLSDLLELIKVSAGNPDEGVHLIVQFLKLDKYVCERCDDSDGGLGDEFNYHAIDVLIPFAKECSNKDELTDLVFELINDDDYGCHNGVLERIGDILPEEKIRELMNRTFENHSVNNYVYIRLANALNDAPLLINLLESRKCGILDRDYRDIAKCFLASGCLDEALKWALKIPDDLYGREEIFEEIYKRKGDSESLKKLYEKSYLCFPGKEKEKQIIALCGQDEFQKIKNKKIEAIKNSLFFSSYDMEYLLDQSLVEEAEKYLYIRRDKIDGIYFPSTFIKKIKKSCSPLTQTIICRVPLNYYLNNAKSKYYCYAAKYLMYLTEISFLIDDWKNVQCHDDYYNDLYQKHYRKKAFWNYLQ